MSLGLAWLETARAFVADFDILLPDARGHGASAIDAAGYSVELVAADTLALGHALGSNRPALVGHSNGALAAAALAADRPDFASRVVLVDPPIPRERKLDTASPGFQAWRRAWVKWMEALKGMDPDQQTASYLAHQMAGDARSEGRALGPGGTGRRLPGCILNRRSQPGLPEPRPGAGRSHHLPGLTRHRRPGPRWDGGPAGRRTPAAQPVRGSRPGRGRRSFCGRRPARTLPAVLREFLAG